MIICLIYCKKCYVLENLSKLYIRISMTKPLGKYALSGNIPLSRKPNIYYFIHIGTQGEILIFDDHCNGQISKSEGIYRVSLKNCTLVDYRL